MRLGIQDSCKSSLLNSDRNAVRSCLKQRRGVAIIKTGSCSHMETVRGPDGRIDGQAIAYCPIIGQKFLLHGNCDSERNCGCSSYSNGEEVSQGTR